MSEYRRQVCAAPAVGPITSLEVVAVAELGFPLKGTASVASTVTAVSGHLYHLVSASNAAVDYCVFVDPRMGEVGFPVP